MRKFPKDCFINQNNQNSISNEINNITQRKYEVKRSRLNNTNQFTNNQSFVNNQNNQYNLNQNNFQNDNNEFRYDIYNNQSNTSNEYNKRTIASADRV